MLQRAFANSTGMRGLTAALLGSGTIPALRQASPLPDEAQRVIDNAVIGVGLERLVIVGDWLSEGLVYNLPNPLSVTEVYHEKVSKVGHAKRVMNPTSRGENQLLDRSGVRTPVYITMDDFQFPIRTLLASERVGAPLDTAQAAQTTRRVNEAIEDAAINGWNPTVAGNSTYGLLTHPNVNTVAYTGNEAWDAAGHTGEEILTDVLNMIEALQGDRFYGPYNLYVPTSYGIKLMEDFKANSGLTIQRRLEEVQAGGRGLRVRVADNLPADRTVMMQMTSDVADVIVGEQPTLISWTDGGPGWELFFAVLAIMVPRIKSTYTGQSGIVKGYTS